jgi:hypothetical protein
MENSVALKQLIRKNAYLFWYTKEFFLNYADKEQIKELFKIVGIDNAATEFFKQIELTGARSNYIPQLQNYFSLYFKKYAPQYS